MKNIILASASPRRKELLGLIPITFEVITKSTEESIDSSLTPVENVMNIADQKADAVASDYTDSLVIGCDTIVVSEGRILGKPKNEEDAYNMLKSLSGKSHKVYTGVSLKHKQGNLAMNFFEETTVYMKEVTDKEILRYIDTKDPMDKAGAYGIQTQGALLIDKIEGDYFNVVGLPVSKVYENLKKIKAICIE